MDLACKVQRARCNGKHVTGGARKLSRKRRVQQ
jgi:hypothetical protein